MSSGKLYKRRDFIGSLAGTALALPLGGCRQSTAPTSHERVDGFAKAHWIIGFSNASEMNTWRTALREAIEQETDKYDNVDLIITDAQESPAKQIADLEDLLARGVSGLIIGPVNPYVANPILEECHREQIPTVIVDRKVSSDKYTTFVSSDQSYMATNVLEKLIELIGNAGEIAIVEGIPARVRRSKGTPLTMPSLRNTPPSALFVKPETGHEPAARESLRISLPPIPI